MKKPAEPTKLDPIVSEFATQEEADAYDAWFRKKVQASLDDPRPSIPHDEAMARIRATLAQSAQRNRKLLRTKSVFAT